MAAAADALEPFGGDRKRKSPAGAEASKDRKRGRAGKREKPKYAARVSK